MQNVQKKVQRSRVRQVIIPVILAMILVGMLAMIAHSVAETPVVFKAMPGWVVGCASPDTGWKQVRADSPICKRVLKGQYEVEWVSPAG